MQKLISIGLRGGGILGKFLLTFLITKEISLEFQGEFSLMNANIALMVIFTGFDFYIYSNRLIVKDNSTLIFIFKNSLVFYFCSYLVLIPVTFLLYWYGLVPIELIFIFYVLSILEHLGQELFRIYIAIERVVFANILFFLRSGLWSLIIVFYLFFIETSTINLYYLLLIWSLSTLIAVIIGVAYLPGIKEFSKTSLDKTWIIKGIKVGAAVFFATILLKAIEYSDRYLIDFFLGKKELGIYSFFFQLANIINVVVFTLYISFIYPKILKNVYAKNQTALRRNKNEIYKSTLIIAVAMLILYLLALPYLLEIMGRQELDANKNVLFVLILSTLFFNFSFGSHFVLIAEEREKLIIKTTFIAFIINLALNIGLIPLIGIYGSAVAIAGSSFALWIAKLWEEKRILEEWRK